MLEKLENKIKEEMEKVFVRDDLSLEDVKILIEIKNSLEMKDFLKESMSLNNNQFTPIPLEIKEVEIK